jgi:hypothetical protein
MCSDSTKKERDRTEEKGKRRKEKKSSLVVPGDTNGFHVVFVSSLTLFGLLLPEID